ncbi:hypothetical protein M8C21_015790 [Ambrosia artemisiifolia]|uniref:BTB domain-containing protein n=1 Tax=Ambrosia artemisiifolia TaxID=4212 RepID=A0AAD5GC20_AMBAR|nr:hypothetical protein M8C21_015790 [Ambrosia artemisiifolia]
MESNKQHEQPTTSVRRSLKRKLEDEFLLDRSITTSSDDSSSVVQQDLASEVLSQVHILHSTSSSSESDRALIKRSIHILSELAKNEDIVNLIVESGAVPALVRHLEAPDWKDGAEGRPYEHEVEKGSAFTLGLLAIKPEHQQLIVDAGALPHLVALLKRHRDGENSRAVNGVIRRAADAITNLAHENSSIKSRVRVEGGIPPLVELLEFVDAKVQRAAAGALRTLAFKNDENKTQIVDCNALPTLILMLRSEDAAIHYEAIEISSCSESQREAALLLGQFAAADTDCKVHIVQRGAVGPLVEMLQSPDAQLREMSAFALGRLAQKIVSDNDTHNQAGIAHGGGIPPLLKLLDSRNGSLQHNAAFALYGLADNEDNVADLIRVGGVQKLQDGEFIVQPTRDCVAKTLKRLEEKIHGRVLSHLLYLMRIAERSVQRRVALALSHLCSPDDQKTIFVDANGKRFYAHRICLLASSDAFRAMFDGGYKERDAKDIEIPNIRWDVFELMMRYIYTGSVDVNLEIAQDLLRAADQYLLEGLKRLCEYTIAQDIRIDNVSVMYDLSEAFNAVSLRNACILFVLENFDKLNAKSWYGRMYGELIKRILPEMRDYFVRTLGRAVEADMRQ